MNGLVEVRIRHAQDTDSNRLCAVPLAEVDTVIPRLEEWGVYMANEGDVFGTGDMAGQFVLPVSGPAYFEIIVGDA